MNNEIFISPSQAAALLGFSHPNTATRYLDQIGFETQRTPGGWRRYSLPQLMRLKDALDAKEVRVKDFYRAARKESADDNLE